MELIKQAKTIEYDDSTKEFLKKTYYNNENFDKKGFYFITHRSETAGCAYLDRDVIKYLIINKRHLGKGVEEALISNCIKRANTKTNEAIKSVYLDKNTTNVDNTIIDKLGFK